MAKLDNYEFLQCNDGFYFGRALKNGNISADSRKIESGEIVQMFAEILENYCLCTGKPMVIEREGRPAIEARIIIKDAGDNSPQKEE